jgi:hypothetical protein
MRSADTSFNLIFTCLENINPQHITLADRYYLSLIWIYLDTKICLDISISAMFYMAFTRFLDVVSSG